jgi:hypothetical protein
MACGNPEVSRDGLRSDPVAARHPQPRHALNRDAAAAVATAHRIVIDAERHLDGVVRGSRGIQAVRDAERALSTARRQGVDRAELHRVEAAVDKLKRAIEDKAAALAARDQEMARQAEAAGRSALAVVLQRRIPSAAVVAAPAKDELTFGSIEKSGLLIERFEVLEPKRPISYADLTSSTEYRIGDHRYVTDAAGRPALATGELHWTPKAERVRHAEGTSIGRLGDLGDIGGHLIAAMFGGFGSGPNLVPQNMRMNSQAQLAYGQMERTWSDLLQVGARVFVDIRLQESAGNRDRPDGIFVRWRVDSCGIDISSVLHGGESGTFEAFFANTAEL